ncbi:MAG: PEGA domain-containing protein [Candidatus Omnitrophota bacterium]|jgi:hypothetical protein
MIGSDKIFRMAGFYFSALSFLIILPIVLSYSLGYKIDYKAFKIYKTGIIYINSQPSGASVLVNGKLYKDPTPAQIEELKPGIYKIEVKREGFYAWEGELVVEPNMATRADKIVLFPVTREMKILGKLDVMDFMISDSNYLYYFTNSGLFRSATDGSGLKKISSYSAWPNKMNGKKFSPDGDKILYFNDNIVFVAYLTAEKNAAKEKYETRVEEVLKSPDSIIDAFWYYDSGYIIAVTDKDVKVIELRGGMIRNIASLYRFSSKPGSLYYDEKSDSLYFTDIKVDPGLESKRHLYRLDLRRTFFDSLRELLLNKETGVERSKK